MSTLQSSPPDTPPRETGAPAAELAARREAMRGRLAEDGLEAALFTDPRDLLYLSGVICSGVLHLPVDREPTLIAHRIADRLEASVPFEVRSLRGRGDIRHAAGGMRRVGVVTARLSASQQTQLVDAASPAAMVDISPALDHLRMRKSDWEIAQIRQASTQAHGAISLARDLIGDGASDLDTQLAVEAWLRRDGHPGLDHGAGNGGPTVVVLAGPDAAVPGYLNAPLGGPGLAPSAPCGPKGHTPSDDEAVIVDLVGHHAGYFADQTQTLQTGELAPQLGSALEVCEEALAAMESSLRAGIPVEQLYAAATDIVNARGLARHWMGAGDSAVRFVGHGIGLAISEPPYVTSRGGMPLEDGTVLALEPKLMFPEVGAVGVEHTYVVRASGAERLTRCLPAGQERAFRE
jgi:Xaa-Pro dipeptidase